MSRMPFVVRSCHLQLLLAISFAIIAGSCSRQPKKAAKPRPEIVVEATRTAVSKVGSPQDVRPYDESLTWAEYQVKRVTTGELPAKTIRVAHWAVMKGQAVPVGTKTGETVVMKIVPYDSVEGMKGVHANDDLDVTTEMPPRFLDLSQPLPERMKLSQDRCDYGGTFSEQMQLYWKLRGQLKLVVMGNSHATKGISTPLFFEGLNSVTPVALNLAPPGGSIEMQCLLIREYVLPLPKVEWVVWVASPRLFNEEMADARKFQQFSVSTGRSYDVQHRDDLWPVPSAKPLAVKDLGNLDLGVDSWGWDGRRKLMLPENPAEAKTQIAKEADRPHFTFSEERWKLFGDTVRALNERGVRVILVTLPMHPAFKDLPVSDPDGTTHEGNAEVIRHLEKMQTDFPLTWFRDFNHDAHHEFANDDFYDADHINRGASREITKQIISWMEGCKK